MNGSLANMTLSCLLIQTKRSQSRPGAISQYPLRIHTGIHKNASLHIFSSFVPGVLVLSDFLRLVLCDDFPHWRTLIHQPPEDDI